jgi:hypothetical protein
MRSCFLLLLLCSTAHASPDGDWTQKYPAAAQALAAIAKEMKVGASSFGGFVEKSPDESKKLAEWLRQPQKPDPSIDDKMEDFADKNSLEQLSACYTRQMTFGAFSQAFYSWAKKYPDASTALLTTPGVARPLLPFYDEMSASPPQNAEEAVGSIFGALEKSGKNRLEKYDEYKSLSSLPRPAAGGEIQKLFREAARGFFATGPYMRNEDNARQEVLVAIPTAKSWFVSSEPTDLYEDALGRKKQMMHRTLSGVVVVRRDKEQCMVFADKIFERRRQEESAWGPVEYWTNPDDTSGRRIDCAKVK